MSSIVTTPTQGQNSERQPSRISRIIFVAIMVASAIGFGSLSWKTSLDSARFESEYNFKDSNLIERRVGLNSYLIVGYGIYSILGAIAVTQWKSSELSISRWWMLFPALFWLWCGLSLIWSVDPSLSMRRIGHLYMALAGGFGIAVLLRSEESIWAIILAMSTLLALGFVAELSLGTFRPWSSNYRHCGLGHPNETGLFAAIMVLATRALMFIASARNMPGTNAIWRICFCFFLFGIYVILIAKSRTTLVSMIVALLFFELFVSKPTRTFLIFGISMAGVAATGLFLGVVRSSIISMIFGIATIGRSTHVGTLTGRVPLWTEILKDIDREPMLGHGYGAYWTTKRVEDFARTLYWEPPNGHSIYIDCLVELGWIGFVLMLLFLVVLLGSSLASYFQRGNRVAMFCVSLTLMAIIHGLTEASFFKGTFGPMILAFTVFACAAQQSETEQEDLAEHEGLSDESKLQPITNDGSKKAH